MPAFSIRFLGTGTSVGVPVIGCPSAVCQSDDTRNKRTRSSIIVHCGELAILIDTGPDLREKALREKLTRIDAVFYTHAHRDHVVGFDEFRAFSWRREGGLPIHASASCMESKVRCIAVVRIHDAERSIEGIGNGPINAFVHAMECADMKDFKVTDYRSHAVRGGSDANAAAYVQVQRDGDGKMLWGAGIDPSIEMGSLKALVTAWNLLRADPSIPPRILTASQTTTG